MSAVVAVDVGGTHVRFAVAEVAGKRVVHLGEPATFLTAGHPGLEQAWAAFAAASGRALPRAAAIAVAGPVAGEVLRLTNNAWTIRRAELRERLGLDRLVLVNDFGAVAHAVAQCGAEHLRHVCGPDVPLPTEGVVSVVGPGTGLGVAQLIRRGGAVSVIETEGGHVDFAPLDPVEDAVLAQLRARFGRVSIERIVSGPGLGHLFDALTGQAVADDRALWQAALAGGDASAGAALDRFCMVLGAVAGDIALAHGAAGVAIGGGIGLRLADRLAGSGFAARFAAKGRFAARMAAMPVKLIVHPQPGLFGAAAAFAAAQES